MHALLPLLAAAALTLSLPAAGQEAAIRKTLGERIPQLEKIDEIQPTAMPGLYEVRVGTDLFYTDAKGNYLIQGELFDTRARRNLTEDRITKLTAVDFAALPLKDAFTIVRGDGKRKLAVFEDPNCGYCKRFERDLQNVDNITIYLFLYPILSPDSAEKSRNIWCAADRVAAWQDLMVRDKTPPAATCDTSALQRNLAFGRKHKITGTPTLIFTNGARVPGAIGAKDVEKRLAEAGDAKSWAPPAAHATPCQRRPGGRSLPHQRPRPAQPPLRGDAHHCHARSRPGAEPARVDSRQLPGARVRPSPAGPARPPGPQGLRGDADRQAALVRGLPGRQAAGAALCRARARRLGAHRLARCAARVLQQHQPVPARRRPA